MRRAAWLLALCALLAAAEARACSVPVFRYALERWKPSQYSAHVFHQGPLTEAHKAALARLAAPANVEVTVVDLDDLTDPDAADLWERHGDEAALPFVVISYPDAEEGQAPAWSGKLVGSAAAVDSPARREVAKRLMRGDSAVWVLLLSGDARADGDAAELLEKELARLQKEIELPEQPEEGSMLLTDLPLRVAFSVVRLDRTKPEEAAFVRLLLDSEEDLDKAKGPIAFPIFGRGRVLVGLEGKSLTAKDVAASAKFLCGACSCRVKELNPGRDLLMTADWDALVEGKADEAAKEAPKEALTAPAIPPGIDEPEKGQIIICCGGVKSRPTKWWVVGLAAGTASALACAVWLLSGRQKGIPPAPEDVGSPGSHEARDLVRGPADAVKRAADGVRDGGPPERRPADPD